MRGEGKSAAKRHGKQKHTISSVSAVFQCGRKTNLHYSTCFKNISRRCPEEHAGLLSIKPKWGSYQEEKVLFLKNVWNVPFFCFSSPVLLSPKLKCFFGGAKTFLSRIFFLIKSSSVLMQFHCFSSDKPQVSSVWVYNPIWTFSDHGNIAISYFQWYQIKLSSLSSQGGRIKIISWNAETIYSLELFLIDVPDMSTSKCCW